MYDVRNRHSLREGVESTYRRQLVIVDGVLRRSSDPSLVAHEARRNLKIARALLRLASSSTRSRRSDHVVLREVGRCIASIRDADVVVQTARLLWTSAAHDPRSDAAFTRFLNGLEATRDALFAGASAVPGPFARARQLLRAVHRRWPELAAVDDRTLLTRGVAASYASGRAGRERCLAQASDAHAHHELRKRVKDLRHQVEFLDSPPTVALSTLSEELHHLGDLLGHANDLVMLEGTVEAAPGSADAVREPLVSLARARRRALWAQGAEWGARLFSDETDRFVERVWEDWEAAQTQG